MKISYKKDYENAELKIKRLELENYSLNMKIAKLIKQYEKDRKILIDIFNKDTKQLKEQIRKMKKSKSYKILKEWEEFIKNKQIDNYTDIKYVNKLIELKEKYK